MQDTYVRYRRGGDFNKLMSILKRFVEIKHELNSDTPFINWRYILFRWNDSDEEMNLARKWQENLESIGFAGKLLIIPKILLQNVLLKDARNMKRFSMKSGALLEMRSTDKALKAEIRPEIAAFKVKAGKPFSSSAEILNAGGAFWKNTSATNRRHITLGISLLDRNRAMINRNFGRACFLKLFLRVKHYV